MVRMPPTRPSALALARWEGEGGATGQPATRELECQRPANADLILLNYKGADFVGHKYGPDSTELRATLGEMDRHLARVLRALEAKVGRNYLLAVTADHGMPSAPSSPARRHFAQSIVDLLHEKFDPEAKQLITSFEPENSQMFVDEGRLSALRLTLRDLANFLESQPFVFVVFTQDDVRLAARAAK